MIKFLFVKKIKERCVREYKKTKNQKSVRVLQTTKNINRPYRKKNIYSCKI